MMLKYIREVWKKMQTEATKGQIKGTRSRGNKSDLTKKKVSIKPEILAQNVTNERPGSEHSKEIVKVQKIYDRLMKKCVNVNLDILPGSMLLEHINDLKRKQDAVGASFGYIFNEGKKQKKKSSGQRPKSVNKKLPKSNNLSIGWLGQPTDKLGATPMVETANHPSDIATAFFSYPEIRVPSIKKRKQPYKAFRKGVKNYTGRKNKRLSSPTSNNLIQSIPKDHILKFYDKNLQKNEEFDKRQANNSFPDSDSFKISSLNTNGYITKTNKMSDNDGKLQNENISTQQKENTDEQLKALSSADNGNVENLPQISPSNNILEPPADKAGDEFKNSFDYRKERVENPPEINSPKDLPEPHREKTEVELKDCFVHSNENVENLPQITSSKNLPEPFREKAGVELKNSCVKSNDISPILTRSAKDQIDDNNELKSNENVSLNNLLSNNQIYSTPQYLTNKGNFNNIPRKSELDHSPSYRENSTIRRTPNQERLPPDSLNVRNFTKENTNKPLTPRVDKGNYFQAISKSCMNAEKISYESKDNTTSEHKNLQKKNKEYSSNNKTNKSTVGIHSNVYLNKRKVKSKFGNNIKAEFPTNITKNTQSVDSLTHKLSNTINENILTHKTNRYWVSSSKIGDSDALNKVISFSEEPIDNVSENIGSESTIEKVIDPQQINKPNLSLEEKIMISEENKKYNAKSDSSILKDAKSALKRKNTITGVKSDYLTFVTNKRWRSDHSFNIKTKVTSQNSTYLSGKKGKRKTESEIISKKNDEKYVSKSKETINSTKQDDKISDKHVKQSEATEELQKNKPHKDEEKKSKTFSEQDILPTTTKLYVRENLKHVKESEASVEFQKNRPQNDKSKISKAVSSKGIVPVTTKQGVGRNLTNPKIYSNENSLKSLKNAASLMSPSELDSSNNPMRKIKSNATLNTEKYYKGNLQQTRNEHLNNTVTKSKSILKLNEIPDEYRRRHSKITKSKKINLQMYGTKKQPFNNSTYWKNAPITSKQVKNEKVQKSTSAHVPVGNISKISRIGLNRSHDIFFSNNISSRSISTIEHEADIIINYLIKRFTSTVSYQDEINAQYLSRHNNDPFSKTERMHSGSSSTLLQKPINLNNNGTLKYNKLNKYNMPKPLLSSLSINAKQELNNCDSLLKTTATKISTCKENIFKNSTQKQNMDHYQLSNERSKRTSKPSDVDQKHKDVILEVLFKRQQENSKTYFGKDDDNFHENKENPLQRIKLGNLNLRQANPKRIPTIPKNLKKLTPNRQKNTISLKKLRRSKTSNRKRSYVAINKLGSSKKDECQNKIISHQKEMQDPSRNIIENNANKESPVSLSTTIILDSLVQQVQGKNEVNIEIPEQSQLQKLPFIITNLSKTNINNNFNVPRTSKKWKSKNERLNIWSINKNKNRSFTNKGGKRTLIKEIYIPEKINIGTENTVKSNDVEEKNNTDINMPANLEQIKKTGNVTNYLQTLNKKINPETDKHTCKEVITNMKLLGVRYKQQYCGGKKQSSSSMNKSATLRDSIVNDHISSNINHNKMRSGINISSTKEMNLFSNTPYIITGTRATKKSKRDYLKCNTLKNNHKQICLSQHKKGKTDFDCLSPNTITTSFTNRERPPKMKVIVIDEQKHISETQNRNIGEAKMSNSNAIDNTTNKSTDEVKFDKKQLINSNMSKVSNETLLREDVTKNNEKSQIEQVVKKYEPLKTKINDFKLGDFDSSDNTNTKNLNVDEFKNPLNNFEGYQTNPSARSIISKKSKLTHCSSADFTKHNVNKSTDTTKVDQNKQFNWDQTKVTDKRLSRENVTKNENQREIEQVVKKDEPIQNKINILKLDKIDSTDNTNKKCSTVSEFKNPLDNLERNQINLSDSSKISPKSKLTHYNFFNINLFENNINKSVDKVDQSKLFESNQSKVCDEKLFRTNITRTKEKTEIKQAIKKDKPIKNKLKTVRIDNIANIDNTDTTNSKVNDLKTTIDNLQRCQTDPSALRKFNRSSFTNVEQICDNGNRKQNETVPVNKTEKYIKVDSVTKINSANIYKAIPKSEDSKQNKTKAILYDSFNNQKTVSNEKQTIVETEHSKSNESGNHRNKSINSMSINRSQTVLKPISSKITPKQNSETSDNNNSIKINKKDALSSTLKTKSTANIYSKENLNANEVNESVATVQNHRKFVKCAENSKVQELQRNSDINIRESSNQRQLTAKCNNRHSSNNSKGSIKPKMFQKCNLSLRKTEKTYITEKNQPNNSQESTMDYTSKAVTPTKTTKVAHLTLQKPLALKKHPIENEKYGIEFALETKQREALILKETKTLLAVNPGEKENDDFKQSSKLEGAEKTIVPYCTRNIYKPLHLKIHPIEKEVHVHGFPSKTSAISDIRTRSIVDGSSTIPSATESSMKESKCNNISIKHIKVTTPIVSRKLFDSKKCKPRRKVTVIKDRLKVN